MTIGLDLSSIVAGIAISENNKIIDATAIDISIVNDYDGKSDLITSVIDKWLNLYNNITDINVEAALNTFAFGKTNKLTLVMLIKNTAVISYILSKKYPGLKINSINVNTARKKLFGRCRIKSVKPKIFVKMMIESTNPEVMNFYIPMKSDRCKNENSMNEDLRDASVLSLY